MNIHDDIEFYVGQVLAYNSLFKTWSVEHYSKCSFRCAYCCFDSQGKSISTIDPEKLIASLDEDIQNAVKTGLFVRKQTRVILSCHTDPYVYIDDELLLTRNIIRYLISINQPFSIVTRGVLIQRDFDLLKGYKDNCDVSFSLPVINPEYIKKFEPHVPSVENRINTITATHNAGIKITVRIDPWIPGVTDVNAILQCLPKNIDVLVSPLMLSEVFQTVMPSKMALEMPNQQDDLLFNKYLGFTQRGFCRTATKLFNHLSQSEINNAYIKERNLIGFRRKVKWFYPPIAGSNINDIAYRFLKPGEIPP